MEKMLLTHLCIDIYTHIPKSEETSRSFNFRSQFHIFLLKNRQKDLFILSKFYG